MKEGGTVLGGQGEPPDSSSGAFEDIKPRYPKIAAPLLQNSFGCAVHYVRSIGLGHLNYVPCT